MLIQNLFLSLVASTAPVPGVESVPPTEAAAMEEVTALIERTVREQARLEGKARRDAHAKHHGCVKARMTVLDGLAPEHSVGVFARPRAYQAWIRFSNGSGRSQDDSVGDGRGMAIKLVGVPGPKILEDEREAQTHDFLLINHPTFFVKDAADYVEFQRLLSAKGPGGLFSFFFPSINPMKWRLTEAKAIKAIQAKQVASLLDTRYWSMTPSLYGARQAKYSVRPCAGEPASERPSVDGPSFLRENLKADLARSERCFEFLVQLRGDPARMPIEDPTAEWSESAAPFVPVARITIPRQDFATPERDALCENLSMTPWHALLEHRPLGGINRVRKVVYQRVSRLRHALNGVPRVEPTSVD
jgi:hypothetical protein